MNFVRNINKCKNNDIKKDLTILFNIPILKQKLEITFIFWNAILLIA